MNIEEIYGDLPLLETKRLILRKITLKDLEDMYEYGCKEEVSKYVTWETHKSLDDTKQFIEFLLSSYANKKVSPWGIEDKKSGKFIGTIGFMFWNLNDKKAELGYVIAPNHWNRGITTEAAKAVLTFGFQHMELVRIQARCFVENKSSARVMEKIGMSFEGIMRKGMFVKGKHQDIKMYSILKEEFFTS